MTGVSAPAEPGCCSRSSRDDLAARSTFAGTPESAASTMAVWGRRDTGRLRPRVAHRALPASRIGGIRRCPQRFRTVVAAASRRCGDGFPVRVGLRPSEPQPSRVAATAKSSQRPQRSRNGCAAGGDGLRLVLRRGRAIPPLVQRDPLDRRLGRDGQPATARPDWQTPPKHTKDRYAASSDSLANRGGSCPYPGLDATDAPARNGGGRERDHLRPAQARKPVRSMFGLSQWTRIA